MNNNSNNNANSVSPNKDLACTDNPKSLLPEESSLPQGQSSLNKNHASSNSTLNHQSNITLNKKAGNGFLAFAQKPPSKEQDQLFLKNQQNKILGSTTSNLSSDPNYKPTDLSTQPSPTSNLSKTILKPQDNNNSNGLQDELVFYQTNAKLYRFDTDKKTWKERGVGSVVFMQHTKTNRVRLIMYSANGLRMCANHYILSGIQLTKNVASDRSWVYKVNNDYSDMDNFVVKEYTFAILLENTESTDEFKLKFEEAQKINQVAFNNNNK